MSLEYQVNVTILTCKFLALVSLKVPSGKKLFFCVCVPLHIKKSLVYLLTWSSNCTVCAG